MKNIRTYLIIAIVIAALVAIKLTVFKNQNTASGSKPKSTDKPINAAIYVVKKEKLSNRIFLSGTLIGNESVDLQAEIVGKVVGIYFVEGQQVNQGQLLVKLNDADLKANLQKLLSQEKLALAKVDRLQKLLAIQGISQEENDAAINALQSIQADVEITKVQMAKTDIRAPFTGTIGLRNISNGSNITSSTIIATLEQLNPMKLDFTVPEKYAGIIKNGDLITFTVAGKSERFTGKIYAINPKLDIATRSIQMRAICANSGGLLLAGTFAKIDLQLGQAAFALQVPTQAIVPDINGQKVFVLRSGKCQPAAVQTGIRSEETIEIIDGLVEGDSVLISGLMQAKPGAVVKVVNQNNK